MPWPGAGTEPAIQVHDPDWESNLRPFDGWAYTLTIELHGPGWITPSLTIVKLASSGRASLSWEISTHVPISFPNLWGPPLSPASYKQTYGNDRIGFSPPPCESLPVTGWLPAPLPAPLASSPQLHDRLFTQRTRLWKYRNTFPIWQRLKAKY